MVNMQDLGTLAVLLVVVTIVAAMGVLVSAQVQDEAITFQDKSTATDEVTALVDTEVDLTGEHSVVITEVTNSSNTLDPSNYTEQNNNFVLLDSTYNNTKLNVTHDYYTENSAYNITGEGINSIDTLSGFLPVIAIVIIASVIIGIVASSFGRKGGF